MRQLLISLAQLPRVAAKRPRRGPRQGGAARNGGSWPGRGRPARRRSRPSSGCAMAGVLPGRCRRHRPAYRARSGPVRLANEPARAASDSQALAAFGAARGDHRTSATGLHAHEKAVGAGASGLRGLVGAFHGWVWAVGVRKSGKLAITARKSFAVNDLPHKDWRHAGLRRRLTLWITIHGWVRLVYNPAAPEELVHNER